LAANTDRQASVPGMFGWAEKQARPLFVGVAGFKGMGVELPQLRMDGSGR